VRLVQGLRDLHPPYITKTDDCDWLEILLLWTAHTPCGVNSLRKSNQIESNQMQTIKVALTLKQISHDKFATVGQLTAMFLLQRDTMLVMRVLGLS
jgi:hypothetical protein